MPSVTYLALNGRAQLLRVKLLEELGEKAPNIKRSDSIIEGLVANKIRNLDSLWKEIKECERLMLEEDIKEHAEELRK